MSLLGHCSKSQPNRDCSCGGNYQNEHQYHDRDCCGGSHTKFQTCIPMHKQKDFPFYLDRETHDLKIVACDQKIYSLFRIFLDYGFALLLNGQGPPKNEMTSEGMYYIDTDEGSMWRRSTTQWIKVMGPNL